MTPAVLLACLRGTDPDERAAALAEIRAAVAKGGTLEIVARRLGMHRATLLRLAAGDETVRDALGPRQPGNRAGAPATLESTAKATRARWAQRSGE